MNIPKEREADRDRESGVEYFWWIYRETDRQTESETERQRESSAKIFPVYIRITHLLVKT